MSKPPTNGHKGHCGQGENKGPALGGGGMGCQASFQPQMSGSCSVIKFTLFEELANQVQEGRSYVKINYYGMSKFGGQRSMLTHIQRPLIDHLVTVLSPVTFRSI